MGKEFDLEKIGPLGFFIAVPFVIIVALISVVVSPLINIYIDIKDRIQ